MASETVPSLRGGTGAAAGQRARRRAGLIAACLLLAGCWYLGTPSAAPPEAATARRVVTVVASVSATATPVPRAQTATPRPATPTPALTPIVLAKGPDVVYTGDSTSMKIVWQLDATTGSRLVWGTGADLTAGAATTVETGPDHVHAYTITGLAPATKYRYRVIVGTGFSAGSFFTAPEADATRLKFFAYGDTRSNPQIHDAVAARVAAAYEGDPAFQTLALLTGDLVEDGDQESSWTNEFFAAQYTHIRAVLAHLAVLPVMGNHEGTGALFARYFPMPFVGGRYWSFDYGPIHVAMVDQYVPWVAGTPQYAWLQSDLGASRKTWKFIVLHEPGWSAGGGHANNPQVQADLQPLAVQDGVAMVLAGHNHYYARAVVDGVQHVTLGTGGAPLYGPDPTSANLAIADRSNAFARFEIDGNTLTMVVVRVDGSVVETLTLTR